LGTPEYFNSLEEFEDAYDTLPIHINGFSAWAKSAGSMGNILSTSLITKTEYDSNVIMAHEYYADDVFDSFQEGYYGLCIYRNKKLVEVLYLNGSDFEALKETRYLYTKVNLGSISTLYSEFSGGIVTFPNLTEWTESYNILNNKDSYSLDIILGNEYVNELSVELVESRRDCIAFIGLPTRFIQVLTTHTGDVAYPQIYLGDVLIHEE